MMTPGAYGLRFPGLPETPWLAVRGGADWPALALMEDPENNGIPDVDFTTGTMTVPRGVPLDEVIHPLLGHAGLALARASGHDAIHAGALLGAGGAWLVVGRKEVGKSTLMGAVAAAGAEVLADDVAVLAGGEVLAGPRTVDLRHRPDGGPALVRTGTRWRVTLAPVVASAPLRGVVFPEWGPDLVAERLTTPDVLRRLAELRHRDGWPIDPRTLLEVAAVPGHLLRRPRDLSRLPESVEALRELAAA